ncbi:sphingomyelin phosphodiesterase-like [Ctenocephalides felis]|uniref:sphingomyelin phosphodiesterase-like n=1 Tax=Ctenocephalides felis TaxID=7515 RepID=UPI000E6E4363|nr:sphingomyelin phosphodiesterase-like [Ctenocephalides felis]
MWVYFNRIFAAVLIILAVSARESNSQKLTVDGFKGDPIEEFRQEYSTFLKKGEVSKKLQKLTDLLLKPSDENDCAKCQILATFAIERRRNGTSNAEMNSLMNDMCIRFKYMDRKMCENMIYMHLDIVLYIIDNTPGLTSSQVCGLAYNTGHCTLTDPRFDWKIDIDNNKPINIPKPNLVNHITFNILHLSDIHYDPKYEEGKNALCGQSACCRNDQGPPDHKEDGAGKWGDYRGCDTPKKAMEDAIQHIKYKHRDIDFAYFTGDMIDHAMWETSTESNIKTMKEVLIAIYPLAPKLYPVLGNHESHPANLFSPTNVTDTVSTQWLYNASADVISLFMSNKAAETIRNGGYYTVQPKPGLRVIALNNNVAYIYNLWLLYDPAFPKKQLQWLHDTLLEAERTNEKVHILGHVPPGEPTNFITWDREYRRIIQRFSHIITGQFNGHTHNDEFKIFYDSMNSSHPINVAFNGGSITTYVNRNPNYKIYKVNAANFEIVDIESWYYDLAEANKNSIVNPEWKQMYGSFKTEFGLNSLNSSEMHRLVLNMKTSDKLGKKYFEYKVKRADPELKKGCDKTCLKNHMCAIVTTVVSDLIQCKNIIKSSSSILQHLNIYVLGAIVISNYLLL